MLLSQLQMALSQAALPYVPVELLNQPNKYIQLYRVKDCCKVLYTSGVAFQLEKAQKIPALEIATAITSRLSALAELMSATEDDFSVQVVPPGWIYFYVGALTVAKRLQSLAQAPPWWGDGEMGEVLRLSLSSSQLFAVQYAHARCCSLVRLAHRQGLISLSEPEPQVSPPFWSVSAPDPIPWLDANQQLCLVDPAECNLLRSLLQLLDDISCCYPSPHHPTSPSWEKAALDLSQAFQNFHSRCQIWGEVRMNSELAQARIGLVMATQSVLWLLLQGCSVYPLLEL